MKSCLVAVSTLICICFVGFAAANPIWLGEVPPDADTSPPSITIISPENKSYDSSSICLNFTVSEGESKTAGSIKITAVSYKADWMTDNVTVYYLDVNTMIPIQTYSKELNLTDIPQGTHSITINAIQTGTYNGSGILQYYTFTTKNSASITFTVNDQANPTPQVPEVPIIAILPLLIATTIMATQLLKKK
jgi:hypothetical protein